jgi:environmental stress-induced protein Ves
MTLEPERIALADTPPVPWRNGGGVTRELLAWPHGGDWQVRISVAEIASDGPFSSFPGVDRWFAVLSGGGVALTIDGRELVRRAGDPPLAFSGEAPVACRLLQGPSRDLNLMLRGIAGAMLPAVAGEAWTPRARRCGLYALVAGRCRAGAVETELPADSLAWFDPAPASLAFHPDGAEPGPVAGWWLAAGVEKLHA